MHEHQSSMLWNVLDTIVENLGRPYYCLTTSLERTIPLKSRLQARTDLCHLPTTISTFAPFALRVPTSLTLYIGLDWCTRTHPRFSRNSPESRPSGKTASGCFIFLSAQARRCTSGTVNDCGLESCSRLEPISFHIILNIPRGQQ